MSRARRVVEALRTEGLRSAAWRAAKYVSIRTNPFQPRPLSTVYADDIIAVDWSQPRPVPTDPIPRPADGYRVAWIITPPSPTSGGHRTAFRFMRFLEQAGHRLTVYLYAPQRYPAHDVDQIRRMLRETAGYPDLDAEIVRYDPDAGLDGRYDAVVASDWEASYAAARHGGDARRFSFVQDFEPFFYPAGSDYVLAENSYRLGFHGLAIGRWMAAKVREYGMACDAFEFAVDPALYHRVNTERRADVVFYVRPATPRRATEFGILALGELHRRRPDIVIHLVGGDLAGLDVPFPHVDHGVLDEPALNRLYNRCAAALVLSLTNLSLVPLEAMAAGAVPVVNDAPNTRGSFDGEAAEFVEFAPMVPGALAQRLADAVDRPDQVERSAAMARAVGATAWSDPGAEFVAAFERVMAASS